MPAAAIEPPKSTKPDPFQQSAMSGKSPMDLAAESGPQPPSSPPPEFGDALRAAQSKDKGAPVAPTPEPPKPAPATPDPAPAPKVPGLPPQTPPADDWQPKGQVAKHFDALKTKHAEEIAAQKAETERLKSELAAARAGGSAEDIAAAKKQLEEYKAILKDVAIERDPEFKQRFSAKENSAIEAAKIAAGDHSEQLAKLLAYPESPWRNEQIDKLVDNLSSSAQRRVNAALQILAQVDVERSAEIASRRQTFEQKQHLTQAQQRENDSKMQKAMETEFQSVHDKWSKEHPFFTEREGDTTHNENVQKARALSKAIFGGQLSPQELATAAHWAATGPLALEGWSNERKARLAAETSLDKMRGVNPGEGRQDGPEGESSREAPKPGTPEYLKYMSRELRERQAKDFAARRGVK